MAVTGHSAPPPPREATTVAGALTASVGRRSGRMASKTMPKTDRLFSILYDFVSVYGISLLRPIVALVVIWGAFAVLFALGATSWRLDPSAAIDWQELGQAALTSASNIFAPFYNFRQSQGWEAAAYLGQSLLSIPLIAVFILALRWRFRRG